MQNDARIFVAGHRGMVGSAIVRTLQKAGYGNLLLRSRTELDLCRQSEVEAFFRDCQPEYVFLAAARVGGIIANSNYKGEFIHDNLMIQDNIIHNSWKSGVARLLFLGSTCIYPKFAYPKFAPQPIPESALLTGPLEETNQGYHCLRNGDGEKYFEIFWQQTGWFWRPGSPGSAPEGEAIGPFTTSTEAYQNAMSHPMLSWIST